MKAALLMPRARLSEKAIKLIDGKNFGNLAFVMSDGSPHVSPVWVDREGDLILVNTAEGRAKAKYLKANHRVALSIFNQQDPYEKVVIQGTGAGHDVERSGRTQQQVVREVSWNQQKSASPTGCW